MTDASLPVPSRPRVLLLDDDLFALELLEEMIEDLGSYAIACETDARRALQAIAAQPPALLVCDLSMPGMDGIEFLGAAASAGFRGQVMLLSGMDEGVRRAAERLAKAHGLAVLGAFQKPIGIPTLKAALAQLAPGSGSGDNNEHNVTTLSGK